MKNRSKSGEVKNIYFSHRETQEDCSQQERSEHNLRLLYHFFPQLDQNQDNNALVENRLIKVSNCDKNFMFVYKSTNFCNESNFA